MTMKYFDSATFLFLVLFLNGIKSAGGQVIYTCDGEVLEDGSSDVCYRMGDRPRSWSDSRSYCRERGGTLSSYVTDAQSNLFEEYYEETSFWAGLFVQDSKLVNDTNATPEPVRVDYSVWDLTEPFSAAEDHCVRMSRAPCEDGDGVCQEIAYLYSFTPCQDELYFVCVIPVVSLFSLGGPQVGPGFGNVKFSVEGTLDYDMYLSNNVASKEGSDLACINDDPTGETMRINKPIDAEVLELIARTRVLFEIGLPGLDDDTLLWVNNGEEKEECFAFSLGSISLGNYKSVTGAYIFSWPCDEELRVLCQIPKSFSGFYVPETKAEISSELIRQVNQDVLAHSDVIRIVSGLPPSYDYYGEDYPQDGDNPLFEINSGSLLIICNVPFLSTRQSTTLYRQGAIVNRYVGQEFYEVRDLIYYFDLVIDSIGEQSYDIIDSAMTYSCDANDLPDNQLISSNTLFVRPTDYEIYSIHFSMDKIMSNLNWTDTLLMSLLETLPFESSDIGGEFSGILPDVTSSLSRKKRQTAPQLTFQEVFEEITLFFSDSGYGYGLKPLIVRDETDTSSAEIVAYAYKAVNGSNNKVFTDISKSSDGVTKLQLWFESAIADMREIGVIGIQVRSIDWCWERQIEDNITNRVYNLPLTRAPAVWESAEICAGDNKPLVTVECAGNKRDGFEWAQLIVNPLCDYTDSDDEPSEITQNLQQLSQDVINSTNVDETIEELDDVIVNADPDDITPTDVNYIADIIQKATTTGDLDPDTVEEILKIADEVSDLSTEVLSDAQDLGNSSNRLLAAVDSLGGDLDLGESDTQTVIYGGLALAVYDLTEVGTDVILGLKLLSDGSADTITTDALVSQYSGQEIIYDGTDAAIYLPEDFIRSYDDDYYNGNASLIRLVFNVYKDTALYRYGESNETNSDTRVLNSHVVAAQLLVNGSQITDLGSYRVRSVFQPLNIPVEEEERPNVTVCVYWDFTANDGTGGWLEDGCSYNRTADGRDVCECDHLTNFAVLVTYYDQSELEHEEILGYISIIGLTLSIVCLACTMLSFLCIKKLRKTLPQQVLFQLCLALILSWIIFLAGIESTSNEDACIAVAALLHYFILASFMWMLMEGVLQYLLFVRVMNSYFPNFLLKVTIISWVVPAIIVGIICATDYKHYDGGDDYCWMDNTAFYYGFAIPVGLILLTNLIVFIMVTISLCRRRDMSKHSTQQTNQTLVNIRASFFSFVLLGLAWIFGFLAIEEAQLVFQYMFCIFATLQGVVMFIMMTLRDKQVRQYWKALFSRCCSCISPPESSTTASSNSKTGAQDKYHIPRVQHTRTSNSTTFTSGGNSDRKVSLDNAIMMTRPDQANVSARNGSEEDEGTYQLVSPEAQPTDDNDKWSNTESWPDQVSPSLPEDGEIVIGTGSFYFTHP